MPLARVNLSESKKRKTTETKMMQKFSRKQQFHQKTTKVQTVIEITTTMMKKTKAILNMGVNKIDLLL